MVAAAWVDLMQNEDRNSNLSLERVPRIVQIILQLLTTAKQKSQNLLLIKVNHISLKLQEQSRAFKNQMKQIHARSDRLIWNHLSVNNKSNSNLTCQQTVLELNLNFQDIKTKTGVPECKQLYLFCSQEAELIDLWIKLFNTNKISNQIAR